ncbi:MAG: hypothetical protein JJE04_27940 [Acidobacteriia bacterium]|nr:hypothetical protein [Terriglobia bacterium]
MKRLFRIILPLPALLLALACSDAPKTATKKDPPKPVEPVSGRYAFYQMYGAARSWAQDLQGMQMQSITLNEVKEKDGKYPAWRVTFVSDSKRSAKTFTYSVVTAQGLNKGIYSGSDENYSGPRGQNAAFPMQALKIDSDAAHETAAKKGADYSKKHPDIPITMVLENIKQFPNPVWRVLWGQSIGTSNFSIYVDASTGDYLQTMH